METGLVETFESLKSISEEELAVTESARGKIAGLLKDSDGPITAVRVFVSGGGCSGMNYGMTFAETPDDRDSVLEDDHGCRLLVDPVALAYMNGAEIDYTDDGVNATFVFNNVFNIVGGSGACGGCGGAH
jgi:iron-sulfur cluster assembly accessory protein|tara:strand:+ start:294 stop:683 length:390 start_codon:yes stop_codon:yes gene_type:complete